MKQQFIVSYILIAHTNGSARPMIENYIKIGNSYQRIDFETFKVKGLLENSSPNMTAKPKGRTITKNESVKEIPSPSNG